MRHFGIKIPNIEKFWERIENRTVYFQLLTLYFLRIILFPFITLSRTKKIQCDSNGMR
jgi:hypothetical protein